MLFRIVIVLIVFAGLYAGYEIYRFSSMVGGIYDVEASYVVRGPEDAKVTMVEFIDYNCSFCRNIHPSVKDFLDIRPDVRYTARPIAVLGEESEKLARVALAAGKHGIFWEMHDAFLGHKGDIDEKFIRETVALYGVDYPQLMKDADSQEIRDLYEDNAQDALRAHIYSTPTIVIGRTFIGGTMDRMPTAADFVRIADEQG